MSNARLYNFISILFLLLTVGVIAFTVVQFLEPPPVRVTPQVLVPTVAVLPSQTPSVTPTFTLTPTVTPSPTPSFTPSPVPTETPTTTLTPTITDTPQPTPTPSITPTVLTDTPAASATATGPTPTRPSPFPFQLREADVVFVRNQFNDQGCAFQGIGGQVQDLNGDPLNGIQIYVFGPGVDRRTESGFNTAYGPGGWEIPTGSQINGSTYFVELRSELGTVISPRIEVTFPSNCDQNVALVYFQQARPL